MKAIVLSGGGMKGAYQAGALLRLEEMGFMPDTIYGVSTGAINSFGFAFGNSKKLVDYWLSIKKKSDIFESIPWWKLLWREGLYSLAPLEKWMKQYAGLIRIPMSVGYVDLHTGRLHHFRAVRDSDRDLAIRYTLASAAQPPGPEPVDHVFVDGGVRDQTPLKIAIDDGADVIRCVLTNPYPANMELWKMGWPPLLSIAMRCIDIINNENMVNDIERCLAYNQIEGKTKIDLKFISPPRVLYDTFEVDPNKIKAAVELGYQDAHKLL